MLIGKLWETVSLGSDCLGGFVLGGESSLVPPDTTHGKNRSTIARFLDWLPRSA